VKDRPFAKVLLPHLLLSFHYKRRGKEERLQEHREKVHFNWCALSIGYKVFDATLSNFYSSVLVTMSMGD